MSVSLEEMDEEQLKRLQDYLRGRAEELRAEQDWREAEEEDLLPLLRGLMGYIAREYLHEEDITDDDYEFIDGEDDEYDELDF